MRRHRKAMLSQCMRRRLKTTSWPLPPRRKMSSTRPKSSRAWIRASASSRPKETTQTQNYLRSSSTMLKSKIDVLPSQKPMRSERREEKLRSKGSSKACRFLKMKLHLFSAAREVLEGTASWPSEPECNEEDAVFLQTYMP